MKISGAQPGNKNGFKHGLSGSSTYMTWIDMRRRCDNPSHPAYKWYGARGITVCERWSVFKWFLEDMGERPAGASLDRIDNNGNYASANCRWVGAKEQGRNKRTNRLVTARGETLPVSVWAERSGLLKTTIIERLNRGWTDERAVTEKAA